LKLQITGGQANPAPPVGPALGQAQVEEIARTKMPDLNAADADGAAKIVEGTARSMGITVDG
jgi:large subunit ribosomal protein L11